MPATAHVVNCDLRLAVANNTVADYVGDTKRAIVIV